LLLKRWTGLEIAAFRRDGRSFDTIKRYWQEIRVWFWTARGGHEQIWSILLSAVEGESMGNKDCLGWERSISAPN